MRSPASSASSAATFSSVWACCPASSSTAAPIAGDSPRASGDRPEPRGDRLQLAGGVPQHVAEREQVGGIDRHVAAVLLAAVTPVLLAADLVARWRRRGAQHRGHPRVRRAARRSRAARARGPARSGRRRARCRSAVSSSQLGSSTSTGTAATSSTGVSPSASGTGSAGPGVGTCGCGTGCTSVRDLRHVRPGGGCPPGTGACGCSPPGGWPGGITPGTGTCGCSHRARGAGRAGSRRVPAPSGLLPPGPGAGRAGSRWPGDRHRAPAGHPG